jgi:hypothetical protein
MAATVRPPAGADIRNLARRDCGKPRTAAAIAAGILSHMLVALFVLCAACLGLAGVAVLTLRPRLSKHRGAAASFAVPGVLLVVPAGWLFTRGGVVALVPLVTIAALCFAAAALFIPTSSTRFAAFEREFWDYVRRQG